MSKSFSKASKKGPRSGPRIRISHYPYIDNIEETDDSLNEPIEDLKKLLSKINRKADIIFDAFQSEESESSTDSDFTFENRRAFQK